MTGYNNYARHHARGDLTGIFLINYMAGTLMFGVPLPLLVSFVGFNPCYVILEEFFLPHPYDQTSLQILFAFIFSFIILEGIVSIFYKGAGIAITVALLLCLAPKSYLLTLSNVKTLEQDQYLRFYRYLQVFAKLGKTFIGSMTISFVSYSQVCLTIIAWFTVRCVEIVPTYFVIGGAISFLGGLGLQVFILCEMASAHIISASFVKTQRARFHSYNRGRRTYIYTLGWKSRHPVAAYCGEQFIFTKDSIMAYLEMLSTNVTNAVLLIIP